MNGDAKANGDMAVKQVKKISFEKMDTFYSWRKWFWFFRHRMKGYALEASFSFLDDTSHPDVWLFL